MDEFFNFLSQNPVLAAIFFVVLAIWVFESLRARSRFVRGEKFDRRSWIVIILTMSVLAGASLIVIPKQLEKARNEAERAVEKNQQMQDEMRRREEINRQQN